MDEQIETHLLEFWKMTKSSVLVKTEGQHSPFIIQLGESCCTLSLSLELTDEGTVGQSTPGASPVIYRSEFCFRADSSQRVLLNTSCLGTHSDLLQCEPIKA